MRAGLVVSRLLGLGVLLGCQGVSLSPSEQSVVFRLGTAPPADRWFKGNTHTHTSMSDGDSPPETVIRWYRTYGYNFLVISDHNVLTSPGAYSHLTDSAFILISGEELTTGFDGVPVHVNGLRIPHRLDPQVGISLPHTIQKNVDAIRAVGGVPHVNHPNLAPGFDHRALRLVRNDRLLEIFNAHPNANNEGGNGRLGMEAIWDSLLTGGKEIYGIAVDDAHEFRQFGPNRSNPGRGWVMVRASQLNPAEIMTNLEAGRFYASTGVELTEVVVDQRSLTVHIAAEPGLTYSTAFIGRGGRVIGRTERNPAIFVLEGQETYVRAKVTDSLGRVAWVQPVFTEPAPPEPVER